MWNNLHSSICLAIQRATQLEKRKKTNKKMNTQKALQSEINISSKLDIHISQPLKRAI